MSVIHVLAAYFTVKFVDVENLQDSTLRKAVDAFSTFPKLFSSLSHKKEIFQIDSFSHCCPVNPVFTETLLATLGPH